MRLVSQRVVVDAGQIHFLKFIVEAYDNLAIMSTVDRSIGLVEFRYPAEVTDEVNQLLDSLSSRVFLRRQS
jgi:hypothetical protein